ncbi:hypothetical protein H0H93_003786 [Arthromyces matolae]|nr:hypothetical protein H0H93_003786 [Arthromyces matolae]
MLGFDSVGKTTILYQLKLGKLVHSIPTIGFNIETVEYKNISFTVWDVGGQGRVRAIWRHYYRDTNAIIFVVDSSERDNHYISIVREELYRALNEPELHNIPLLVLANKKDIEGGLTTEELNDKLGLRGFRTRAWKIQSFTPFSFGVLKTDDQIGRPLVLRLEKDCMKDWNG